MVAGFQASGSWGSGKDNESAQRQAVRAENGRRLGRLNAIVEIQLRPDRIPAGISRNVRAGNYLATKHSGRTGSQMGRADGDVREDVGKGQRRARGDGTVEALRSRFSTRMAALAPGLSASAPRQSSARMSSAGRPLASIPRTRFCPSNAIASPAPCADDPAGWFQYLCQSRSDALLTFQGRRKVRGISSLLGHRGPNPLDNKADIAKVQVTRAANIATESDFQITYKVAAPADYRLTSRPS
jgi:hypothetical protein